MNPLLKNAVLSLVCFFMAVNSRGQIVSSPAHPAQRDAYLKQLKDLESAVQNNFYDIASGFYKESVVVEAGKNAWSYLWPLCGLIQAGNEIKKVDPKDSLMDRIIHILPEYYDPAPPAPGYASYVMKFKGGDRFYDDNQWIGIACLDAYSRSKRAADLRTGQLIYRYMMTGFDTTLQGGIYWQETKKISKNTCSNGPGILVALQLYKATRNQKYLDTALMLYSWTNKHLQAPSGLYYDNVRLNGSIQEHMFSYNTGTMLQSNVYLYEITHDKKYLSEAQRIADTSSVYFLGSGRFRDSYWFSAVLLRAYQHLLKFDPDLHYIRAFQKCLDNALETNRNGSGVMGKTKPLELVPQSGMLEILARFAWLEKTYPKEFPAKQPTSL